MKIIHIINKATSQSVLDLINEQRKVHDIEVIKIDVEQPDYDAIIDQVISCDRVISWSNVQNV